MRPTVLPPDAAPIWGRWLDWFAENYRFESYQQALIAARRHSVMCSPEEDRVLFPYIQYSVHGDSPPLAVWGRAAGPFRSLDGGERPRYYLWPPRPFLLWEAAPTHFKRLLITEGAVEAIKLTEFTSDYAVATRGTHCSQECIDRINELTSQGTWEAVVVYDMDATDRAWETASLLKNARAARVPWLDVGAATPTEIQEWHDTNFS